MKKVVLLFGGTGALGSALADGLSQDMHVIVCTYKIDSSTSDHQQVQCDVTNWESVHEAVRTVIEQHGRLDVVVNSTGQYASGKVEDIDPEETKKVFEVNAVGALYIAKAVVPYMKQAGAGLMIHINSRGGLVGKNERSVYNSSKWALTGITKNLQKELAPFNIRVTDIYPSALETSMQTDSKEHDKAKSVNNQDILDAVRYVISRPNNILVTGIGVENVEYH